MSGRHRPAIASRNADWLNSLNYIDFLRDEFIVIGFDGHCRSLRLIFFGCGNGLFVFEHHTQIAHINPSPAFGAFVEMVCFVGWRTADTLPNVLATRNFRHD